MRNLRIFFWMLVFALISGTHGVYAQDNHSISGKVISPYKSGMAIEGAIVTVTGAESSVRTDSSGYFSLEIPGPDGEIEVWAQGFHSDIQPVAGHNEFTFVLIPANKENYSQQKALPFRNIETPLKASAANNVNKEHFRKDAIMIDEAVQNAFPGLQIVNKSGMPGEGSFLNARGINSFVGNTAPLIVINGVPFLPDMSDSEVISGYSSNVLNALSSSDIKNITFLKGANASIYGSLGSNGVLQIEMDDATDLETRVEYVGQYGIATNQTRMPVMEPDGYKAYISDISLTRYEDMADVLENFPYLRDDPDYYYNYLYNNNTDWQEEITSPSFVTENILKIKGGDAIAKYDLSFGYLNQQGYVDNTGLERYHMRLNSDINVSEKVQLFATMSMAYLTNDLQEQGMSVETNPLLASMAKAPLLHPYRKDADNNILPDYATIRDEDGNILVNNAVSNPVALVNTTEISSEGYDVLMNGGVNYQLNHDFKLTGIVGLYHNYNRENLFVPGISNNAIMPLADGLAENTVRNGIGETFNVYYNAHGSYNKKFNDIHTLEATAGFHGITSRREFDAGEGRNTSSDFYKTLDNVNSIGRNFRGYINEWTWMNFFSNVSYNYNQLVSAGLNVSFDGSSASGPDHTRFGVFPALNTAVHLKNLPAFRQSTFLNRFNIRAEYGLTGNGNFSSELSEYYYQNQVFRQLSGIVRAGIPNTELKWENNQTMNVGMDLSFFKHRVDISIDAYRNDATDVLLERRISSAFGINAMYDNLAEIRNQGIEASLQAYVINSPDFSWLLGGTVTTNQNEVISLGGEDDKLFELSDGSALVTREGESVYSFYGYQTDGVFATSEQAENSGLTTYAGLPFSAGDVRFADIAGNDDVIDKRDRVILGDPNPDFFGRLFTSIRYKGVRLSGNFIYSYGNDAYNAVRREFESMRNFRNQLESVKRRWSAEGDVTDMPRAVYGDPMENNRFSDRWIEDASYLKLKTLTLEYQFGENALKFMQGGSVYVTGENLWTLTDYLGADPEFSYSYNPMYQGFDYGKMPLPQTYKLGFKLQF